ncbi:hypothetical protein ACFXPI_12265 [Streptomyces sp. NPDC059104]|uniref:hypothetical protein n=1 Tax=Streptomyces sp. NPDC059104 TaxID=3346729 RepID=UPI00367E7128
MTCGKRSRDGPAKKSAVILCGTVPLLVALSAAPVGAAPILNQCGGEVADYVGTLAPDAAFSATVTIGGTAYPMTITPKSVEGRVRIEFSNGADNPRYAIDHIVVRANSSGVGQVSFKTYAGDGWSTQVVCGGILAPTRVTQINGPVGRSGRGGNARVVQVPFRSRSC